MAFNRYTLMEQLKGPGKRCTVAEFAKGFGYTERQVGRWMSGESRPSEALIRKMAEWFGLTYEDFVIRDELMEDERLLLQTFRLLSRVDQARALVAVSDVARAAGVALPGAAAAPADRVRDHLRVAGVEAIKRRAAESRERPAARPRSSGAGRKAGGQAG